MSFSQQTGLQFKFSQLLIVLLCLVLFFLSCPMVYAATENTLRLAVGESLAQNPLCVREKSARAFLRLAYRSLFFLDDQEMLRSDLVEEAKWSADYLNLELTLRQDVSFNDGKKLSAEDAAYSLVYYRYYLLENALRQEIDPAQLESLNWAEYLQQRLEDPLELLSYGPAETGEGEASTPPEEADTEESEVSENKDFSLNQQLQYFNTLQSDPQGIEAFRQIKKVEILDDKTLCLHLEEKALRLPWYLSFPLVPQRFADNPEALNVPGISAYSLEVNDEEAVLKKQVSDGRALCLKARYYPQFKDALKAFNEDKLDLLLCPPWEFNNLNSRHNVRSIAYENCHYYCLVSSQNPYSPCADPDFRLLLRQTLESSARSQLLKSVVPIPHRSYDWRSAYLKSHLPPHPKAWLELQSKLGDYTIRLAALSNSYNRSLVQDLKYVFYDLKINLELKWLNPEEYEETLKKGDYDLLLWQTELSLPTDVRSLYADLHSQTLVRLKPLGNLSEEGLVSPVFFYNFDLEESSIPHAAMLKIYDKLQQELLDSEIFVLGFSKEGMLLGPRIKNRFKVLPWDPYRYVEEITLWP